MADGMPFTSFAVDDVQAEFDRLSANGVTFVQPPTSMGPVTTAVFDDTCGNLIQIASMAACYRDRARPPKGRGRRPVCMTPYPGDSEKRVSLIRNRGG